VLNAAPLKDVATWAEQYRPVWDTRFDLMDRYLKQLQQQRIAGANDD
jgi:hypothetical protein